ncbi:trypsin-like peptidase domain-containing protein [Streptomyces sp. NRRL S-244]|uniref:VMAP-C domain-containing protein n=1 Tax=Streptomyces sp. NRRL S-244 TaxID=1463897 RepID=UPI0004BE67A6|nr:trypsin-like peptidase domain-containing protein [Streptomyces sp. NRRL S-244]
MGWFRRPAAPVFHAALLRESDAKAAGAAVLLSPNRLLTCAHVVNDALGREPLSTERPAAEQPLSIAFRSSGAATRQGAARLSVWLPPRPRPHSIAWDGDLAVLDLEEAAPEWATPVVWREMSEGLKLRAWHGGGVAITYADTVAGHEDGGCWYLDGTLTGAAIGPGYSGGPLWVRSDVTVAGLVIAQVLSDTGPLRSQDTVRRGWALPWQTVREQLTGAGADDVVAECRVADPSGPTCTGPGEVPGQAIVPMLRALLDDPARRADHCRDLAVGVGWEPPPENELSAPTLDELAALLLTEARALATLTESLAPAVGNHVGDRRTLNDLLAFGRLEADVRLLSVTEHRQLVTALRTVVTAEPDLISRAAREALRFMELPEVLAHTSRLTDADVDHVVLTLEDYPDGRGGAADSLPVPALLRLAEFVAAAVADPGGRMVLRAWCDRVAGRLGISRSALGERRADAEAWASHRPSPVTRIVVRLTRAGADSPENFLCEIWLGRRDGTRTSVTVPQGSLPPDEIGRLIRRAAEGSQAGSGHPPTQVDVVVGADGLEIPVDSWQTGSELGDVFPDLGDLSVALGSRYQVALRCPELSGRVPTAARDMRRRWAAGGTGTLVVDEPSVDIRRLHDLLKAPHHDTTRVVLHGSPEQRSRLLPICLAMGVPVVLWDRAAESHEDAARLNDFDPTGSLHKLPQRLQDFRSILYGSQAPSSAARPALVWEDGDLALPGPLQLADPS